MIDNKVILVEFLLMLFIIIILLIMLFFYVKKKVKQVRTIKKQIREFFQTLDKLKKSYIAYSDYERLNNDYSTVKYSIFCHRAYISFIKIYANLKDYIDIYNEEFINTSLEKNKKYFDNMFEYKIDEEQRRAILTDDDNNLIIASAGSGKTTTIVGKTKYLLDIKKVNPEEIITISFTNAAKDNFREKLGNDKVKCSTFHKLGLDILSEDDIKPDIAREDFLINTIKTYINMELPNNNEKLKKFIKFIAYKLYPDDKKDEIRELLSSEPLIYSTMRSKIDTQEYKDLKVFKGDLKKIDELIREKTKYEDLRSRFEKNYKYEKLITFQDEKVKSKQELVIANFLFLNGINYLYEAKYEYPTATSEKVQYRPDFYLVDYDIYLEHFGINKDNKAPQYSKEEEKKYLDGIKWKRQIHEEYGTKLIETYSYEFDENIESILFERLREAGVEFHPLNPKKVMNSIMKNDSEIMYIIMLISKFIRLFKGNNFMISEFDKFIKDATEKQDGRNISLLEIIKDIYIYYEEYLKQNSCVDFDDMINLATKKVREHYDHKVSYIIIDEFQDTSFSRYNLVKAIQEKTHAKVIAVGDDWQSIYRFSGCDLALFVNFDKYFSLPKYLYINSTYRNCQSLINISSSFIMKNEKGQLNKTIKSNKENIDKPITVLYYDDDSVNMIYLEILRMKKEGCKTIAILGRNNSDIKKFDYSPRPESKYIDMSRKFGEGVIFSTVHKSKGLEYDGVIICNMEDYIAGFPNKMVDDPIIDYVTLNKDDYLYEEERRLFYVALTRTKSRCTLFVNYLNESIFVKELEKDYGRDLEAFKPLTKYQMEGINPQINELIKNNKAENLFEKNNIKPLIANKFIDVKFKDVDHIYSYYCPEDFNFKINDKIKIESLLSTEEVTVVSEPYYSFQHDYDYKMLKIIDKSKK